MDPDYYAARAPEYDRVYLKPERQADLREIERWLPTVFAGRSLLEVACGTGYWTQFLAPAASRVLAIDAAPQTWRIAQARVPPGTVQFMTGDAYALPAEAAGYESAFAGFWISHVPRSRLRAFLQGLHAALVPGAKVVFLDNRFVPGSSTPIAERDSEGNTYQVRRLDDGSSYRVLKNFPTQEEIRHATQGLAGELRFHEWPHFWAAEYVVA